MRFDEVYIEQFWSRVPSLESFMMSSGRYQIKEVMRGNTESLSHEMLAAVHQTERYKDIITQELINIRANMQNLIKQSEVDQAFIR